MNNNIKLKDLVWKEIDKKTELDKLELKWRELSYNADISTNSFIFNNVKQIAKEIEEIENKQIEYTRQDIIEMFVKAGFYTNITTGGLYVYGNDIVFEVNFSNTNLCYAIFKGIKTPIKTNESLEIDFNNHKSIEFYYNKFREILEFEVGNEN